MKAARVLVAALFVLLLAGCMGIPTSGPVERVSAAPGRVNPGVEIAPAPPAEGAAPVEVIEGFLHAMASYQPGYKVARAYLTEAAARTWEPDAGVRVYAEGTPVVVTEQGARLTAPLVGVVDAQGGFAESGGRLDQDFGLVRDNAGQWRISTPPTGIVLSEYLFRSTFVRVPVYFTARGQRWLLPDSRYFPRGQRALERAVSAVFAGPTTWAEPLVDRPASVVGFVRVGVSASGEADVVVDTAGGIVPAEQRTWFATQLAWTLRAFDTVGALRIRDATGESWSIPGYEGRGIPLMPVPFAEADPQSGQTSRQLFAVVGKRVVRLNEGNVGIETIPIAPAATGVATAAVRHDGQQAAVVDAEHTVLTLASTSESNAVELLQHVGLRRPHYSRLGELWVADGTETLRVAVGDHVREVVIEGLPDGGVEAIRVSPDAARVALIVKRADGRRVVGTAGVVRAGDGTIRVVGWLPLSIHGVSTDPLNAVDVGWRTSDLLMLLVADGRGTTIVTVHPDGAAPLVVGPASMADLVELAVAPGVTPVVRTADGHVYRYNADYRWSSFATDVEAIVYAG